MENWKDVVNYEGLYQVSDLGNLRNYSRKVSFGRGTRITKQIQIKLYLEKSKGYYIRSLSKNDKRKTFSIHRLVALAFIPNPENKREVNHINGIKTDNTVSNLEWVTPSENILHSYRVLKNKHWDASGKNNPNYKHGLRVGIYKKKQ